MPLRDWLKNRRLQRQVNVVLTDHLFNLDDDRASIIEAGLLGNLAEGIIARYLIRKASRDGINVEAAIGDGTFLNWLSENWDEIAGFIKFIIELIASLS